MLLKDVKAGEVYLVARYGSPPRGRSWRPGSEQHHDRRMWENLEKSCYPARVVDVGVRVPPYTRPGAMVQPVEAGTLKPLVYGDPGTHYGDGELRGEVVEPRGVLAALIIMPWQEFVVGYHEYLDAAAEHAERLRVEREQERARQRERDAKAWMEREFSRAKQDIEQVAQVVWPAGLEFCDDDVKALVDLRNPDGNPYLKDES